MSQLLTAGFDMPTAGYIPALRYRVLKRLYDPLIRAALREGRSSGGSSSRPASGPANVSSTWAAARAR